MTAHGAAGTGGAAGSAGAGGSLGAVLGGAIRRGWSSLRWYVTSMMGDTAYATYAEHHRRVHPDTPVPDERTFWRDRFAEQDRTPGSRCC